MAISLVIVDCELSFSSFGEEEAMRCRVVSTKQSNVSSAFAECENDTATAYKFKVHKTRSYDNFRYSPAKNVVDPSSI